MKRSRPPEPPGFAEFWARWYANGVQHGRREHYAQAFAAGQQARDTYHTAEQMPASAAQDQAAERERLNMLRDCRTCRNYTTKSGGCMSVLRCVDGSRYQRQGVVQIWESAPESPAPF